MFDRLLVSLKPYRVVIRYWTLRGLDEKSESRSLILEGDFGELRNEICEQWRDKGLKELVQLAGCQ